MAVKRKTARKTKRKFTPAQRRAQKLFAKRAKAGTLKKKRKRKTVKRKTVKRKTVRKAPSRRKARKNPVRRKAKKAPAKKRTFGRRDRVIRATYKTRDGYRYYYLVGDQWRGKKADATRYSQANGVKRIKAIKDRLEPQIEMVTLEKA